MLKDFIKAIALLRGLKGDFMRSLFRKKIKDQKGQGMIEYIILTGLIGIFCLATFKTIGSNIKKKGSQINTQIKNIDLGNKN